MHSAPPDFGRRKMLVLGGDWGRITIMEDKRLLRIGVAVAGVLILFLIWWLWPPTANPDRASIGPKSQSVTINVLANDTDIFGRNFFIKTWTNGANGGTVALAPAGSGLVYSPPRDGAPISDTFTYSIWTRHGFPSTAAVSVAIKPVSVKLIREPVPVADAAPDCPRGEAHSESQHTPLPKQYGDCFAIYFSWKDGKVFDQHARAVKSILETIAKSSTGKTVYVEGFTDTSGVHFDELSKARACSAVGALKSAGLSEVRVVAFARGNSNPAAATGKGVRDRLNRRVEIRLGTGGTELQGNDVQCSR